MPSGPPVGAGHHSLVELAALLSDRGDSPSQAAARDEIVEAMQIGLASLLRRAPGRRGRGQKHESFPRSGPPPDFSRETDAAGFHGTFVAVVL